jgi:hypothetical protein
MQSENLTDEQLWRRIARNTNAMTALIHQQLELAAVSTIREAIHQAKLKESNTERIGKLERISGIHCRTSSPLFFGITEPEWQRVPPCLIGNHFSQRADPMSAFGTKRTSPRAQLMSAFGGKADIALIQVC